MKLEVLQKRDQEMTEFIEKFDRAREDTLASQKVTRMTIVALLEHISGGLESEHHAPGLEGSKASRSVDPENGRKITGLRNRACACGMAASTRSALREHPVPKRAVLFHVLLLRVGGTGAFVISLSFWCIRWCAHLHLTRGYTPPLAGGGERQLVQGQAAP